MKLWGMFFGSLIALIALWNLGGQKVAKPAIQQIKQQVREIVTYNKSSAQPAPQKVKREVKRKAPNPRSWEQETGELPGLMPAPKNYGAPTKKPEFAKPQVPRTPQYASINNRNYAKPQATLPEYQKEALSVFCLKVSSEEPDSNPVIRAVRGRAERQELQEKSRHYFGDLPTYAIICQEGGKEPFPPVFQKGLNPDELNKTTTSGWRRKFQ